MTTTDTTNITKILTPVQFKVARALAASFGHLWAGVPDGTYDIDDIRAWSAEHQHPMLPGGIYAPDINDSYDNVVHVTGTGRLSWEITTYGNIRLEIYRSGNVIGQPDKHLLVAAVDILNGPEDGNIEAFEFGELSVGSTDRTKTHEMVAGYDRSQVKNCWLPFEKGELHEELLFERHVQALVKPITTLLLMSAPSLIKTEGTSEWDEMDREAREALWATQHEEYKAYHTAVIQPAIEKAKELLQPLYNIAMPEPLYNGHEPCTVEGLARMDEEGIEIPSTFYWIEESWSGDYKHFTVSHHGETFPVESEKTAVHTVLLLQKQSDMSLVEAVKAAIVSQNYRPE